MNLFSIIVPTFNSSKTLKACLQSVVDQTYSSIEIIVIDGLSSDNTLDIVKEYQSKYTFIKWVSEKDNGIYDAMNKGIKLSKGDWLYFLGSDDTLYSDNVIDIVAKAARSSSGSKFIYGNILTSGGYIQTYKDYNFVKLTQMNICHQAAFYHKSLFDNMSYDLQYKIFGDWDLNLKVFNHHNRPLFINEVVAKYSLDGVSSNFAKHPEFLKYFSNYKRLIFRYKGSLYMSKFLISKIAQKLMF